MKNHYRLTLKHDGGTFTVDCMADGVGQAMYLICRMENAPLRAVQTVKLIKQGMVSDADE